MPLFRHETKEDRERRAAMEAEQAASLESLERGGLPVQAQRRLQELRSAERSLFTSDLSVNEFAVSRREGLEPITQVMGSCFYHVGWVYTSYGMQYFSGELETLTDAYDNARRRALGRLREEAQMAGADAVVGVRLKFDRYEWGRDVIEYTAVGTAVRVPGAPGKGRPALTSLSGQDFWKLHQAGYWPVGVAAGTCVFYVVASWRTQQFGSFWGSGWWNQEISEFTQGLYIAREAAMERMALEARAVDGVGIVGVDIRQEATDHEVEINDRTRTDMIFTFMATGTALVPTAHGRTGSPARPVLTLNDK